uniref:Exportin-5 C-terminal domain-containing protein n=1 Tax=Oryza meridionalis TaxID=40149 RepID=A0A0E0F628_9ORYZ
MPRKKPTSLSPGTSRFPPSPGIYKFRPAILWDSARHNRFSARNRFSVLEAISDEDDDSLTERDSTTSDSCGEDNSRKDPPLMEDGEIVNPLVRTLLELFSEEQISEIPLMETYIRRCGISEGMGSHLIEENNFLFGAFTSIVACPWIKKDTILLSSILLRLSEIWSQSEWVTNLLDFFEDAQFRTSVYNVVAFFEDQLTMSTTENSNGIDHKEKLSYSTLFALLPLLLPLLLKLLQYVHSLWTDEVASNVSEKLEGAKFIIQAEKPFGMCVCLEGAFYKLLDNISVYGALLKDLEVMEFRHLTMLIKHTIVPLVKNCPAELWPKWIDMILQPVFHYCDDTLDGSWCSFLYKETMLVPDKFCHISFTEEKIEELGKDHLFEVTREISYMLVVMALPELNGGIANEHQSIVSIVETSADLESTCSSSLVGYLLYHDDLRPSILRLINNIIGYWKDSEARIKVVSFCHMLIQLAISTHNDKLISFVQDNLIPMVVRCLIFEPTSNNNDLLLLCEDAYRCIQREESVREGQRDGNSAEIFENWLSKQMIVARYEHSPPDELEDFVCIWEIEEEFTAYLHTYTEMLHKVDGIGDTIEDVYLRCPIPFVSKHDNNCCPISNSWAMSSMLSRKITSMYCKRETEQKFKFLCKLITFKPYIKCSGYDESVQELVDDDSEVWSALPGCCRQETLEDDKEMLREIAYLLTSREDIHCVQSFQPVSSDFLLHLQPYAQNYIEVKNASSGYDRVKEQIRLHEAFDTHLASGALDDRVRQISSSKDNFVKIMLDDDTLHSQFIDLDYDLLKLSHERRAKLLSKQDQLCLYYKHMKCAVVNLQHRDRLESLICELESEGFFRVDDDSIEWEKEHFSELVDEFNEHIFAGIHLPKYYVIRGVMVVGGAFCRWMEDRDLFWMETRYYRHRYYDIIQEPATF